MDLYDVALIGAGAFVVGVYGYRRVRDVQIGRRAPTAIASCRAGESVKVIGSAVPFTLQRAPLSGRACIAWHVTGRFAPETQSGSRRLKSRSHWQVEPFLIDDGSGRAVVDTSDLPHVASVLRLHVDLRKDLRKATLEASEYAGLQDIGMEGADEVQEAILEPNEQVAIIATVAVDPSGAITLVGPTLISDVPRLVGKRVPIVRVVSR